MKMTTVDVSSVSLVAVAEVACNHATTLTFPGQRSCGNGWSFVVRTLSVALIVVFFGQAELMAVSGESTVDSSGEFGTHDMFMLAPAGPVHLRLLITNGGKSLAGTRDAYLNRLTSALDSDKDGKVSREEAGAHPLFVSNTRFTGNKFLQSLRSRRPFSKEELELAVDRAAGQLVTYRQNNSLAEQDMNVFNVLDQDKSGSIERAEMRLAAASIAERDTDFDQCITFDEFLEQPTQVLPNVVVNSLADDPPGSVHADMLRDATEPVLAARLIRTYDRNRDRRLSFDELGWDVSRAKPLDINSDGQLDLRELAAISSGEPEMTLAVDLEQSSAGSLRLLASSFGDVKTDSDVIRIRHDALNLSISYRHRDPVSEAETNASEAFNQIDVDANGYLDRDEIADHQRFERYLFDAMDRDGDDRVFSNEMLDYVRDYTEPASTTCQITLMDSGKGFFQVLDENADGRISIRELRACEENLLKSNQGRPHIDPEQMMASFRIEIKRGGTSLFGRVDRPTIETPAALLAAPEGPIWFQRMDRNSDGDLTWDEFLGSRSTFHQLDQDHDSLIDKNEASLASKLDG
ncbi:hypothetical protein [Rhodopirellula sp. MGV]|uniref:hypothetical protein n=1 Tax=Rhodopirellula sp. MGV TaxID=2023130 RepID=UPI000B97C634|nr:hypothetical protein [Rhodopirellula sp. MGV]OYP29376.1 hypothetical protein CGZ80_24510 [Rhodopirellula sp. MGV]PNY35682.1 hypothetical protein C2E31_16465 [Rhodopirellula baltica]